MKKLVSPKPRKIYLCVLLVGIVFSLICYLFSLSTTTNFGFYKIDRIDVVHGNHYIYLTHLNRELHLKCDIAAYDLVEANRNSYFAVEFKYSTLFPDTGFVTNINYDNYLTDNLS